MFYPKKYGDPKKVFDHLSAGIRVKRKLHLHHPVMLLIHSL